MGVAVPVQGALDEQFGFPVGIDRPLGVVLGDGAGFRAGPFESRLMPAEKIMEHIQIGTDDFTVPGKD